MNEKLDELLKDEAFIEKLLNQENDTDVQALLAENGIELTLSDISAIKSGIEARLSGNEELSEDDLENVAGGVDVDKIITGVVDGICKLGDAVHKWTRRRW